MPAKTLNSYKDVQTFISDVLKKNSESAAGAPHETFWTTLSYTQFTTGNVPGVFPDVRILTVGDSKESNIIKILRGPIVVDGEHFTRMPEGGPIYFTDDEITSLADWIDGGCPNPQGPPLTS